MITSQFKIKSSCYKKKYKISKQIAMSQKINKKDIQMNKINHQLEIFNFHQKSMDEKIFSNNKKAKQAKLKEKKKNLILLFNKK